ncbi:hypothetical protein PanWU01x14_138370, partial [Parasponia andersonii]
PSPNLFRHFRSKAINSSPSNSHQSGDLPNFDVVRRQHLANYRCYLRCRQVNQDHD